MVVKRSAEIAATSRADDLALRALAEIVAITSDENVRIVGGQMVALLMAAFLVPGISPQRTRDADTAITTELAGSGVLHDRLIAHGWAATSGNNYVRLVHELTVPGQPAPELSVDLLVPSLDARFRPALHGGRVFDSAPGLAPALASEPIEIAARIELLSNTTMEFVARVPTVEMAVVIKAFAYASPPWVQSHLHRLDPRIFGKRNLSPTLPSPGRRSSAFGSAAAARPASATCCRDTRFARSRPASAPTSAARR